MRKVLILNTSHNDLGMIMALKKMNQYVISVGNEKGLVGEQYVDEYIKIDYSDKEAVLELAKEKQIEGVCACCNDFGVVTAAYVAEKMGLKGHDSLKNVYTIHHKGDFKKWAQDNGIITPKADVYQDIEIALNSVKRYTEFPMIVKPVDLSAGNGVNKVNCKDEMLFAIKYAFEKSRKKEIVIERFVNGTQHAMCTFIKDGKVIACCSNNEYSIVNPYRVEIDTFPADNFERVKEKLIEQVEKIVSILHLEDGIFHTQYRMENGQPYIMESMRRVLGNMYSIPAKMVSGFDWDYWEARTHIGMDTNDIPFCMKNKSYAAYRAIMANENGIIEGIYISDEVKNYIVSKYMIKNIGSKITNYMSQPIGFLFMKFENAEKMRQIMIDKYQDVKVIIKQSVYNSNI